MGNYSGSTCKVEATIASQGDSFFLKKMKEVLIGSSSLKTTHVSVKEWLATGSETMLSYMGMITVPRSFVERYDSEEIGYAFSMSLPDMMGAHDSLLLSRSILVCKQEDIDLVSEYCSAHKIPANILLPKEQAVRCWSTWHVNSRKPVKRLARLLLQ